MINQPLLPPATRNSSGVETGVAWDFPLTKSEKRELLLMYVTEGEKRPGFIKSLGKLCMATFPAGNGHPKWWVKSKGIPSKSPNNSGLGIIVICNLTRKMRLE